MRKNILKSIIVLIFLAAFTSSAFAAPAVNDAWTAAASVGDGESVINDTGHGPGLTSDTLKFSANVYFVYVDTATGDSFALGTWNSKGTKVYASNADSSKIYSSIDEVTATTGLNALKPTTASDAWASDTWAEVGK